MQAQQFNQLFPRAVVAKREHRIGDPDVHLSRTMLLLHISTFARDVESLAATSLPRTILVNDKSDGPAD